MTRNLIGMIAIAAAIVFAAMFGNGRYTVMNAPASSLKRIFVIDKWTGAVKACDEDFCSSLRE